MVAHQSRRWNSNPPHRVAIPERDSEVREHEGKTSGPSQTHTRDQRESLVPGEKLFKNAEAFS